MSVLEPTQAAAGLGDGGGGVGGMRVFIGVPGGMGGWGKANNSCQPQLGTHGAI